MSGLHELRQLIDVAALGWDSTGDAIPEKPAQPGIKSITDLKPLAAYAGRQIEFVVEGIVAAGTLNVLAGDSGSGKTTLASAICSSVERGVPFAGLTTQRRPVLMLDRENPLSVVAERFERLGISDGPNFRVWGGWCEDEPADPGSPIITEWVQACEPKPLIVVDSFVAFMQGDENSATETRAYMQRLRRLAEMGATLMVLHHSGKAETAKDFRGSSDIKGATDVCYHLANLGDSSRLGTLRLRAFKQRFAVRSEIILRYTADGFQMDSRGPMPAVTDTLRELLIKNPSVAAGEFEELAITKGIARQRARKFLADGKADQTVSVLSGQHNAKYHTWKGAPADDESDATG